jgi:hypothetical protein
MPKSETSAPASAGQNNKAAKTSGAKHPRDTSDDENDVPEHYTDDDDDDDDEVWSGASRSDIEKPAQKKQKRATESADGAIADDEAEPNDEDEDDDEDEAPPQSLQLGRAVENTIAEPRGIIVETCDSRAEDGITAVTIPKNTEEFKAFLEKICPRIKTGPNQFKYPRGTHVALLTALDSARESVLIDRKSTDYTDTPELQYLRWVSTMAYGYLLAKKKNPVEIQVLWDGKTLYVSANFLDANRILRDSDEEWMNPISGSIHSKIDERYQRHQKELSKCSAPSGLIRKLKEHKIEYIDDGIKVEKHAEIRLVEYWRDRVHNGSAQTIYVAGIKRPCLACYCRLDVLRSELVGRGVDLQHKQRPGMFWPSQSALQDSSGADQLKIMQYLEAYKSHYTTNNDTFLDSDSENEMLTSVLTRRSQPAAAAATATSSGTSPASSSSEGDL